MAIKGKQIADGAITNPKLGISVSAQIPQIINKDLVTSPGGTSIGDMYIIAGTGGNWSGGAIDDFAEALDLTGTLWSFKTPEIGFTANVLDEDALYQFETSGWEYHTAHSLADQTTYLGISAGNVPLSSGDDNVAVGFSAAAALTTGINNIILGSTSGIALTIGSSNVLLGFGVSSLLVDGDGNVVLGPVAGSALTSGSDNVILGNSSGGNLATGDNNIFLGAHCASPGAATSNHVDLGSTIFANTSVGSARAVRIGGTGAVSSTGPTLELESTDPRLRINETDAAVDEKLWEFQAAAGILSLVTLTDAGGAGGSYLDFSRTGTGARSIAIGTGTTLNMNGNNLVNANSVTTGVVSIDTALGLGQFLLSDTAAALDEKTYRMLNSGGSLVLELADDAFSSFADVLTVSRTGIVLDAITLGDTGDGFTFFFGQADNTEPMLLVENAGTDGAVFNIFTGDIVPTGFGTAGDLYVLAGAGVSSALYQYNGTSWVPLSGGIAVQARRTTDVTLTGAFVDVTFDTTDEETVSEVLDHDLATNSDNIIVGPAGTYMVGYSVGGEHDSVAVDARVRVNDTSVLPGSEQTSGTDTHNQNHNYFLGHTFIATLAASDFITLQLQEDGAGATTALAGMTFWAVRI